MKAVGNPEQQSLAESRGLSRLSELARQLQGLLKSAGRAAASLSDRALAALCFEAGSELGELQQRQASMRAYYELEPRAAGPRLFAGFLRGLEHVNVLASESGRIWSPRLLLDLHFDVCYHVPAMRPGRWRVGDAVVRDSLGHARYVGPPADSVPQLMESLCQWLDGNGGTPGVVRAAIAHFHVATIHPFTDGNGRVARLVQALVLARDLGMPPFLCLMDGYVRSHLEGYSRALLAAGGASWGSRTIIPPWLTFCVDAYEHEWTRAVADLESEQGSDKRWPLHNVPTHGAALESFCDIDL